MKIISKTLIFILILPFIFGFTTCTNQDYDVVGVWKAQATWTQEHAIVGTDTFLVEIYYDFCEDGILKYKTAFFINGQKFESSTSDWIIVNLTWSIDENVITLSSGKQFVIVDDVFNDTYPNPKMVITFSKIEMEND